MARKKANTVENPTSRIRTITIGGVEKKIEFNFLAYTQFHKLTGISLVKGVKFGELEADEMIMLLYTGLITHQREYLNNDVLLEALFTGLNGADFDSIYPKVIDACKESFPPPVETDPEDPTKPVAN